MTHIISTIGLGATTFISTNIDDLFVLLLFFSTPSIKTSHIVLGQFLGIGALTLMSILGSMAVRTVPGIYIGLFGLLPLYLGIKALMDQRKNTKRQSEALESLPAKAPVSILSIAAITLGNGGDNIGVYIPIFSIRSLSEVTLLSIIFMAMTGIWCVVGAYIARHPLLKRPIQRYGEFIFPWALIALGIYIAISSFLFT
jgi:cadmium resistance protein CadD (predicted permease)